MDNDAQFAVENFIQYQLTIENLEIREFTGNLIQCFPQEFWTEQSSSAHHPLDERGVYGNILHSLRVSKLTSLICEMCSVTGIRRDKLVSASLMHDGAKHDIDGKANRTVDNHPLLIRKIAEVNHITCQYADDIFDLIENHMGKYGPKEHLFFPDMPDSTMIHVADCIAARGYEILQ